MPPQCARAIYKRKGEIGSSRVRFFALLALSRVQGRSAEALKRAVPAFLLLFYLIAVPPNSERICQLMFSPDAKSSKESIFVVAQQCAGRQLLQFLAISPAQDHIIRIERDFQSLRNLGHAPPPFFLTHSFEPAQAEVCQLHGLQNSVDDHRRSQSRP